jgi:hypothetical protein
MLDIDRGNACRPCRFSRKIEMNDTPVNKAPADKAMLSPEQTQEAPPKKVLTPAAQRALAEAEARRAAAQETATRAKELQGPEGPEPTRFGDWERKGIASDF